MTNPDNVPPESNERVEGVAAQNEETRSPSHSDSSGKEQDSEDTRNLPSSADPAPMVPRNASYSR